MLVWAITIFWKSFLVFYRLSFLHRLSLTCPLGPQSLEYLLSGPFQGRVISICPTASWPSSASLVPPVTSGPSTYTTSFSSAFPLRASHDLLMGLTPAFTVRNLPPSPTLPETLSKTMLSHGFHMCSFCLEGASY